MNLNLPQLKSGDLIDVIAPASSCKIIELELAKKKLESWGFHVRWPKNIFSKSPFYANTDEIRFLHLKNAILNEDSKIIWCVRGGYGSIRLLPELSKLKKPAQKKWLLGHSDITSLHLFLNQKWNWPSLHSPLFNRMGQKNASKIEIQDMYDILVGGQKEIFYENLKPLNELAKSIKKISGLIHGGNLAVVRYSLGTPWQIKAKDSILFFEEIGERGYKIDQQLIQLTQAGVFKYTKAVVFGTFTDCNESNSKPLYKVALKNFATAMNFPVLEGLKVGHDLVRRPLPLNTPAVLTLGPKSKLQVKTGN